MMMLGIEGGPSHGQTYQGVGPPPTWLVRSDAVYELTVGGIAPYEVAGWHYCWRPERTVRPADS